MESYLFSNGRISAYIGIFMQNSQHMPILRRAFIPYCQNMKILKMDFYDVITNELFKGKGSPVYFRT